jgi:cytochrome P450
MDFCRVCVGMKLAFAEIRIVIVKLLQRYRIKPSPQINEATDIHGLVMSPKSVKVLLEHL